MAKIVSLNAAGVPIGLTQRKIEMLDPHERLYQVADAQVTGLWVRVQPSGSKAFYVEGRVGSGRGAPRRRMKIGNTEAVPLTDARRTAKRMLTDMVDGIDPQARPAGAATLSAMISEYQKRLIARGVVKASDVIVSLRSNLKRY